MIILGLKESSLHFFSTQKLLSFSHQEQPIQKLHKPHNILDTPSSDANLDGNAAYKHIYCKKLLWFLCIDYSMGAANKTGGKLTGSLSVPVQG